MTSAMHKTVPARRLTLPHVERKSLPAQVDKEQLNCGFKNTVN
jgi:hypothetical protein